jgi:hypothetical protein
VSSHDRAQTAHECFVELSLLLRDEGPRAVRERMRWWTDETAQDVIMGALLWAQSACRQHGDLRHEMKRTNTLRLDRRRRQRLRVVQDGELEPPW